MWPVLLQQKLYNKEKLVGYKIMVLMYNRSNWECSVENKQVDTHALGNAIAKNMIFPINFTLKSDGVVLQHKYKNGRDTILKLTEKLRKYMERCYGAGTNLAGHCIEASCYLEQAFKIYGVNNIKQIEGWCLFENEDYGSDRPYDEHTWIELGDGQFYIDITADQFNPGFFGGNHFKPIEIRQGTPKEMMHTEPVEGYDYWVDY